MVGGSKYMLEEVLTEKQLHHVVKKYVREEPWELVESSVGPAAEGLAGFLGDHLKATLRVQTAGRMTIINLFIKRIPPGNKPKADFINKHNFYKREMLMFQMFEEMAPDDGPNPFSTRALICNESILVLPDLNVEGYAPQPHARTFDLAHELVAAAALARFHAAFANYHTRHDTPARPYNILYTHGNIIAESTFQPSPWLRASAKLTANLLYTFSSKFKQRVNSDLEEKLFEKFSEACEFLKDHEGTLNVVIHKDLWANNIMFRYEKDLPTNALLIDYQCIRYGPPTFDVMGLLYLTTSREFRELHERKTLHYYYCVFCDSLDEATKMRINELGYDREEYLRWCERSRMMSMCLAIGIFPYILMDPVIAQKTFDDPDTYDRLLVEDRTEPVVAHAKQSAVYRERQVELAEEFIERYILDQP